MPDTFQENFAVVYDNSTGIQELLTEVFVFLKIISYVPQDEDSLFEYLQDEKCVLIITNIKNQETLERIRAKNPNVKIVIFSGYDLSKDDLPSADLILLKPTPLAVFEEKIRELFS